MQDEAHDHFADTLPGSTRSHVAGARAAGLIDASTQIEATLVLRRRAQPDAAAFAGPPLTRQQLAERFGTEPADLESVRWVVTTAGAQVLTADLATRLVRVRGAAGSSARCSAHCCSRRAGATG